MPQGFDHERLRVYQASLEFVSWLAGILEKLPPKLSARQQLDRASTSIPLNIAEGNGKFTERDRCHFFDIARGSALECAAALDVIVARGVLASEDVRAGKEMLEGVVSMLVGLIRSNSRSRVHEGPERYSAASEVSG